MRNPTALGSFNPTQQKTGSRAIEKPCAYWPSKSSMRIQKPFRMISLRKIRQQLPWIDILTKNTGGRGYHQHAERGANPLCHLLRIQPARVRAVLAARAIRVGLYLEPVQYGCGLYWSPCNSRTTPSAFLHKQLDVTIGRLAAGLRWGSVVRCGCIGLGGGWRGCETQS